MDKVLKTLTEILQALRSISSEKAQQNLISQIAVLKTVLASLEPEEFSYEFLEGVADVVEQITRLRLDKSLQAVLEKGKLLEVFDELVVIVKNSVFQHESLKSVPRSNPIKSKNPIETAQKQAEEASRQAAELAAQAEKANADGVNFAKKLQAEQKKPGGLINEALAKQALDLTLAIYAKNTASVIANDQAASALLKLERLLEK